MESRVQRNSMKRQKFMVVKRHYSRQHRLNWVLWVVLLLAIAGTSTFVALQKALQFFALNYVFYALGGVVVLTTLLLLILKKGKQLVTLLCILFIGLYSYVAYQGNQLLTTYNNLQQSQKPMVNTMSVLVLQDSALVTVQQLGSEYVHAPTQQDMANVDALVKDIQTNNNFKINVQNVESYLSAYEDLVSGKVRAIVMNGAYASVIETLKPEYSTMVKTIYTIELKDNLKENTVTSNGAFNVLVSVFDNFQPITALSKSDGELLISVNPDASKMAMTYTPSNALTKIAGNAQQVDLIQHAFIYGVNSAINTSEQLYQTSISYYVRIHLKELVTLIDRLGGIEVDNDTVFTTQYGGYEFATGTIWLDSHKALGYMREDVVVDGVSLKNKHQMAVLQGIFKKLVSAQNVFNLIENMRAMSDAIQTNMPFVRLMEFVNTAITVQNRLIVQTLKLDKQENSPSVIFPNVKLNGMPINENDLKNSQSVIKNIIE